VLAKSRLVEIRIITVMMVPLAISPMKKEMPAARSRMRTSGFLNLAR